MSQTQQDILADLTEPQRQAVTHVDGPLLVLAAAGSGKTRVITRRVAYLINQSIPAASILAVTFTNKAANEMKERIGQLLAGDGGWGGRPTVCTFHSFAARMLRMHHDKAGLPADYSIYDESDRLRAVKLATEQAGLSTENFTPQSVISLISKEKNALRSAADTVKSAQGWTDECRARIFAAYEKVLADAGAVDFDDLLFKLANMLGDSQFRALLADRYRYILIDEYQDTNKAQYEIARRLSSPLNNICATGDPDQSIYGWRGAELDNILRFEHDFPGTRIVRLEQNYRSTQRILAAADALIRNNRKRKPKRLWTENAPGDKVAVVRLPDPQAEAELLADRIEKAHAGGLEFNRMAVFMRVNALTRVLEEAFFRRGIPYQIARGVTFYNRKEIKDVVAYLRLMVNPADRVSLERIINTPTRGIGKTTLDRLAQFADANRISLWQACTLTRPGQEGSADLAEQLAKAIGRAVNSIARFVDLIVRMKSSLAEAANLGEVVRRVMDVSGLEQMYRKDESASANLGELLNAVGQFDAEMDHQATLSDFLANVSLVSDVDSLDESRPAVTLMTLHAAKGLEFPLVFIVGCEEGLMPIERRDANVDIEEERRLFFVGITRAMRKLVLTHTAERMLHGQTFNPRVSPFVEELPGEVLEQEDLAGDVVPRPRWNGGGWRGGGDGFIRQNRAADLRMPGGDRFDEPARDDQLSREDQRALRQAQRELAESRTGWPVGSLVRHAKFGVGKIVKVTLSGPYTKATIDFRAGGLKAVMMEMAPIERMDE